MEMGEATFSDVGYASLFDCVTAHHGHFRFLSSVEFDYTPRYRRDFLADPMGFDSPLIIPHESFRGTVQVNWGAGCFPQAPSLYPTTTKVRGTVH